MTALLVAAVGVVTVLVAAVLAAGFLVADITDLLVADVAGLSAAEGTVLSAVVVTGFLAGTSLADAVLWATVEALVDLLGASSCFATA